MILVDTSVWVDHLRAGDARLVDLLGQGLVATHDFIIGEIACGSLRNRREIIALLSGLPRLDPITAAEALAFVDSHALMGRGIGYVDVCLLGAAVLAGTRLWSRDRRLATVAENLGCGWAPD
ncbi:type II toxin-antitoxin system VapC family toxin [Zavarzinia sp.]|uniref:type II toxin-antitoxin system VapC family toxin n=1 Tax=Zavarzinia sp. TaxID=2027920 RepID=UPI003568A32C